MLYKLLLLIVVITAVYLIFFKKKKPISSTSEKSKKEDKPNSDDVVECQQCGTYVRLDEALIKDAKYYCSTECMEAS